MTLTFATSTYGNTRGQASWEGIRLNECADLDRFMSGPVAQRLNDTPGREEFESHVRGLDLTDFGKASLQEILDAEVPEERDWAIGEALAEALLAEGFDLRWPWNMERDKRNPKASLPGADIVGFLPNGSSFRLALGEVKTSEQELYPPNVMSGRSGMAHQLDTLASDLTIVYQLLKWLHPRCKGTAYGPMFEKSVVDYCNSGNRSVSLFGVLIRDTQPNELDLEARGATLGTQLVDPTSCNLIAVYLPCKVTDLPSRVSGGIAP